MTVEQLDNPFVQDVTERLPGPATLVIFGATGDLAERKLLPAVYDLAVSGRLPERFRLIGVARGGSTESFAEQGRAALERFSRTGLDADAWSKLRDALDFIPGEFSDPALYRRLAERLTRDDREHGAPCRRLFYLATAPSFFGPIAGALSDVGLGAGSDRPTSLLVEKPFGHDLASALELNSALAASFREDQILRIDHYLGKETVQNLLVLRFANGIFEPVWNRRYVDHIQVTVAEDIGVGDRGSYYDRAGALRDIVQNHMLQIVSLVAMEPPVRFAANLIRDEKVKLLRAARRPGVEEVGATVVRGQYQAGWVGGEPVAGYRDEEGVPEDSKSETYVAMRLEIDNWRWAGTPFYLRTGKRLPIRSTEIAICFRPVPHLPFQQAEAGALAPNELIISVQPNEGASLRIVAKIPGTAMSVRPVEMDFQYGASFLRESPEAYERLLHDALLGDLALFTRSDEVEAAWEIVDPIVEAWGEGGAPDPYEAGSPGSQAAEDLLARDGRRWRPL